MTKYFIVLLFGIACNKEAPQQSLQSLAPATEERIVTTYLGDFTVNLNDPQASSLLQMTIAVESDTAVGRKIDEKMPQIRDSIIIYSSEYTSNR